MGKKRISRISIYQSSKFCAMVNFVVIVFFLLLGGLISLFTGVFPVDQLAYGLLGSVIFAILVPLWTFVVYAVVFWFYNFIASMVGGIEVEVRDVE